MPPAAAALLVTAAAFLACESYGAFLARAVPTMGPMVVIGPALGFIGAAALLWRAALVLRYTPAPPCADEQLPTMAVIVPAYNEGEQVLHTLRSLVRSDVPADKLSIIAVDDGSRDHTWQCMEQAAAEHPDRIQLIRSPVNRGKRHALYLGFAETEADVVVTVDSDSEVEPQTIRNLVSPFFHDERVGAVAGQVRVLNINAGLLPRMLDVSFNFSFDFIRASQSVVNAVLCTPGALAAYRRDIVVDILDEWLHQTFGGQPAKIGEDRAMTNLILRAGYHVRYQRDAVVYTEVPTSFAGLCRMFLRWARSNVRETLVMAGFAFRRFRPDSALGARINLVLEGLRLTVAQIWWVSVFAALRHNPLALAWGAASASLLVAGIPAVLYAWQRRNLSALWAFPYALLNLVGLWWITPYALLTPFNSRWLTRQLPPTHAALTPATATSAASPALTAWGARIP